ncbi:unnamed protein product [Zymoseptoria tritici ST99CH_3D1]|nr:unnamed protein product [Zymoseptoria tritici ST99CH_3D1]
MGIQRFGTRLSAHAQRKTLCKPSDESIPRSTAIIDGPGLVHSIYYRLCDQTDRSKNITYGACAAETVRWLEQLREFGLDIEAILFDGALPASKKDVRIERLQAYVTKLQAFKQLSTTNLSSISSELRKSLPPPPFLVFAVVEELLRHGQYAKVTHVVPGEADPYCVAAARKLAAKDAERIITIFSDDADLLVYNPGQNTRVITLRDQSESGTGHDTSWSATEQWPGRIAASAKHPLEDLVRPAFFMSQDLHCTLEQALLKSVAPPTDPDFTAFAETFSIAAEISQWSLTKSSSALRSSLTALDSRMSELVLQLQTVATKDAHSTTSSIPPSGLRVYLPFLHDDPSRSPAWNVGTHLRTLSYSVLLHHFGIEQSVQEYRRSGSRIVSTLLDPYPVDELETQISELKSQIEDTTMWAKAKSVDHREAWRYFTMQHVLRYFQSEGMALPGTEEIIGVLTKRRPKKWTTVQLAAQWQAAFYGLRMISQSLGVVERGNEQVLDTLDGTTTAALEMQKAFESLPGIVEFFADIEEGQRRDQEDMWRGFVEELLATMRKEDEDAQSQENNAEDRPRKKAKKSKKTKVLDPGLAQNPFALLSD